MGAVLARPAAVPRGAERVWRCGRSSGGPRKRDVLASPNLAPQVHILIERCMSRCLSREQTVAALMRLGIDARFTALGEQGLTKAPLPASLSSVLISASGSSWPAPLLWDCACSDAAAAVAVVRSVGPARGGEPGFFCRLPGQAGRHGEPPVAASLLLRFGVAGRSHWAQRVAQLTAPLPWLLLLQAGVGALALAA